MSHHAAKPDARQQRQPPSPSQAGACFKPVALPALAAAVRATRKPTRHAEKTELPAIQRKDASLD